MIRIAKGDRAYCEAFIQSLKARVSENDRSVEDKVAEILKDVRDNGDEAVRRYTMKFDGWAPEKAEITKEEIDALTADCDRRSSLRWSAPQKISARSTPDKSSKAALTPRPRVF